MTATMQINTRVEFITPEQATELLERNVTNRTLSPVKVQQYARDMHEGRWTISNDALSYAPDGRLTNGQHRLHAVVTSGTTQPFLVAYGMPDEAQRNMDIGKLRSFGDVLSFRGEKYGNLLSASARLAVLYQTGRLYRATFQQAASPAETDDFLQSDEDIRQCVAFAATDYKKIEATGSVIAVALWRLRQIDQELAAEFFSGLASLANLPDGSPILALHERLRKLRQGKVRTSQRTYLYLFFKAWNYWRADQSVVSINLPRANDNGSLEPR